MRHLIFFLFLFPLCAQDGMIDLDDLSGDHRIVTSTKQIVLEDFPGAYNPSIIRYGQGYLLTFRYSPDFYGQPWISYIGAVLLNDRFEPVSKPDLLNTRTRRSKTPSQSEDARVFSYRGKLMLIYNDNIDVRKPSYYDRRDMFMAEIRHEDGHFNLTTPIKLVHQEKYDSVLWQKNWVPFEWNRTLFLTYSVNPHEILYPNLMNGECYRCYETGIHFDWDLGNLKLSTPPVLIDGQYWSFFHSWKVLASEASWGHHIWHYFIGVYTFSADPPFNITQYTPRPIIGDGFYTNGSYIKRVIFPGGFVVSGSKIIMAYGKDDAEIWIAEMDIDAIKKALIPFQKKEACF